MNKCSNCKHYKAPSGLMYQRHWCDNSASVAYNGYVYKGDVCAEYDGKAGKKPSKRKVANVRKDES